MLAVRCLDLTGPYSPTVDSRRIIRRRQQQRPHAAARRTWSVTRYHLTRSVFHLFAV